MFNEFLADEEGRRGTEDIPVAELQKIAIKFLFGVRKKQSGYEPLKLENGLSVNKGNFDTTELCF